MRGTHMNCAVAGVVASTVLELAAAAPASYLQLTQERSLTANASASTPGAPVNDPKSETSTDLGSFDRSFTSSAAAPRPNFPGEFARASASASQAVTFGGSSIGGQFQINGSTGTLSAGETASTGNSTRWTTRFTVATPTPFQLNGHMNLQSGGLGSFGSQSISFGFFGDGAGEYFFSRGGLAADFPIQASGDLQPGHVYTLSAQIEGGKFGGATSDDFAKTVTGSINFTLAVPEPASAAGVLALGLLATLRRRGLRGR